MLRPDTERASLRMESIWMEAENRIIQDIVRRIKKNGHITSTADYQINRLIELGKSREEIESILKSRLDATWPQMFKMYDDIAEWQYVRNKDIYEQVNREFIPPEENEWLMQLSQSVKDQTMDELKNISRSYGFTVDLNGKKDKLHLLKGLQKILLDIDKAVRIVRETESETEVVPNLMIGFGIDQVQAEFVAEIMLHGKSKQDKLIE